MVSIHPPLTLGKASPLSPGLAVVAALAVLLGDAALEAAGWSVPRPLPQLGPLGGASALISLLLVSWVLLRRYSRAPERPVDELLPLAVAVFGMGAVLECAAPIVRRWTVSPAVRPELSAPLYRLGMGGSILVALVALSLLVPRYRARLREFASVSRLRSGILFTAAVLVLVYAVLVWLGFVLVGPEVRLTFPHYLPASLALMASQAAIALGEECFYRGLLQREVGRIFRRAGVLGQGRDRRLVAIAAVSLLFAFQHLNPAMPRPLWVKVFLYSFVMSFLLGYLFDLTRNLAVVWLAHLFNNLTVLGLGPSLSLPYAVEAFGGGVYIASYLLVAFALIFLLARSAAPSLKWIRPGASTRLMG